MLRHSESRNSYIPLPGKGHTLTSLVYLQKEKKKSNLTLIMRKYCTNLSGLSVSEATDSDLQMHSGHDTHRKTGLFRVPIKCLAESWYVTGKPVKNQSRV